ncbi:MAG: CDP-glycerol glycerophosphotransferase family protein [Candidatus Marinimicrobia bacterium]|nr:CDP-glycerol glycerophosphotransferase family protein [Candidatus Neomarinimicrobiota bacterium]
MREKKYKIAYFARTDIQHLPPLMRLYDYFGGILYTTNRIVFDFVREKYPNVKVKLLKNRRLVQRDIVKNKIRVVVFSSYTMLYRGKSVQIFHGTSDKNYSENAKIIVFDLVLFPGKKIMLKIKNANLLKFIKNWKLVGYPKFDLLINNKIERKNYFPNSNKKSTVLYAPTWISSDTKLHILNFSKHGESSLPIFGKAIIRALHSDYNLIIKYHNRAYHENPIYAEIDELIKKLGAEENVKVVWDDDIVPYMNSADLMISDISAVCYEWFHFNRPIVFANPSPENYKPSNDIHSNTYAWQAGDVIYKNEDIKKLIERNIVNDYHNKIRNKIFNEAFYKPDGKATERQVEEIKKLYQSVENINYFWFIFTSYLKKRAKSYLAKFIHSRNKRKQKRDFKKS